MTLPVLNLQWVKRIEAKHINPAQTKSKVTVTIFYFSL